jgi:hypothetical protein
MSTKTYLNAMERMILMGIDKTILAAQETTTEAVFTLVHAIALFAGKTKLVIRVEKVTKTIMPK